MYKKTVKVAYAENEDGSNSITSGEIKFEIGYRQNTWQKSVSIAPILYLGEYKTWVLPNAIPTLGAVYAYIYYDENGNELGSQIPMTPGKYSVVAYADAKYCRTLPSEAFFEIVLATNYWDVAPTIEGWSEEFNSESPAPVGTARFGNEYVEFWYENLDTHVISKEKPTTAGNYRLHASVELFGYESLTATWDFTVEPAFDTTFVRICTALGVVACFLTVIVIIFAIKRNKEN